MFLSPLPPENTWNQRFLTNQQTVHQQPVNHVSMNVPVTGMSLPEHFLTLKCLEAAWPCCWLPSELLSIYSITTYSAVSYNSSMRYCQLVGQLCFYKMCFYKEFIVVQQTDWFISPGLSGQVFCVLVLLDLDERRTSPGIWIIPFPPECVVCTPPLCPLPLRHNGDDLKGRPFLFFFYIETYMAVFSSSRRARRGVHHVSTTFLDHVIRVETI